MRGAFSSSAEASFRIERALAELRAAADKTRAEHPEIVRVLLFGSLARGDWTGDSDADLIVVVQAETLDLLERGRCQIHVPSVHAETLVSTQQEYGKLAANPTGWPAGCLSDAMEL